MSLGALIHRLASLRFTLASLALTAAMLVFSRVVDRDVGSELALPLVLLFVNLIAAVSTNPRLNRQGGLLVFHLGLAALALVAATGQLIGLRGRVEITEGAAFDPSKVVAQAAPLHPWALRKMVFVQRRFDIDYLPGMERQRTDSRVEVPDGRGGWREVVVGDDRPLLLGDYRLYTTSNKGFAPLLTLTASDGRSETGGVHLPSYPLQEDRQGNVFRLPWSGRELALWLEIPTPVYDEKGHWEFRKPSGSVLVVVDGDSRHRLQPGDEITVDGGTLRYNSLATWMGYTIFYEPTLSWMLAAAMVAVAGLLWHALLRLRGLLAGTEWREAVDAG